MTGQELARLQERAGQNDPEALYRLAMLHIYGDGVPEDNDLAAALLLRAARQGCAKAQALTGSCLQQGVGTAPDMAEALRWYRLAAQQNDPYAQYRLGRCCQRGEGVEQDMDEALRWYRLSAAQDYPYARQALEALSPGAENAADRPIE